MEPYHIDRYRYGVLICFRCHGDIGRLATRESRPAMRMGKDVVLSSSSSDSDLGDWHHLSKSALITRFFRSRSLTTIYSG
jgi:hypothetical protein